MDTAEYERALAVMAERLSEDKFLFATRMLLVVLHNLYTFPDKEKFRKLKTSKDAVRPKSYPCLVPC